MTGARRGVILPVVLFTLLLLGLLCAMFAFRVNADLAATRAMTLRWQTRLAAEAGVERVKLLLRESRLDMNRWYHNPDELHRIIVWAHDTDRTIWGTNERLDEGAMAYRFSIVADDPTDDEDHIRIGITDESSKLNLNEATEAQLLTLMRAVVPEEVEEINPAEIVAAILDWRDVDSVSQSEAGDTEGDYYLNALRPYQVKNGPFDSVEELLLVKGVTGAILYGEDFDRNGLITDNEDDGEETFPPDNEDNILNRGLYPYLTVDSYESNVSNDNRQRIYLLGPEEQVRAELDKVFEDDPSLVDYIITTVRQSATGPQGTQGPKGTQDPKETQEPQGTQDPQDAGGAQGPKSGAEDDASTGGVKGGGGSAGIDGASGRHKGTARYQLSDEESEEDPEDPEAEEVAPEDESEEDAAEEEVDPEDGEETNDDGGGSQPMRTPAELLRGPIVDGEVQPSPIGVEHLAVLMDRTTLEPPEKQKLRGLININTAPPLVLRCIEELTAEQIEAIVEVRGSLEAEEKATTAWLVAEDVLDLDTYFAIAPRITARGQQFMIDSLGYADHMGMVSRLQVIVDLVGPAAQPIYYRDLTYIGGGFPIRQEDEESVRNR